MNNERFGSSCVILFAILLIVQGCSAILGRGTQQPTNNYVLNSLYSEKTQTQAVADLHDICDPGGSHQNRIVSRPVGYCHP